MVGKKPRFLEKIKICGDMSQENVLAHRVIDRICAAVCGSRKELHTRAAIGERRMKTQKWPRMQVAQESGRQQKFFFLDFFCLFHFFFLFPSRSFLFLIIIIIISLSRACERQRERKRDGGGEGRIKRTGGGSRENKTDI